MTETVTLYKALSPVQLARVIDAGWRAFPAAEPGQRVFAPKLHRDYAEMLARQLEALQHNAGYVVRFHLARDFLRDYPVETIGYCEQEEYRIPVSRLMCLNRAIVGRIELLSGFTAPPDRAQRPTFADACVGFH